MSEAVTLFPSLEVEHVDIFEAPEDYDQYTLKEFDEGSFYEGKPLMSEVTSFTIDEDGEEVPKYRFKLFIINAEEQTYLDININLKKEGDIQENVWNKSVLFALLGGIRELEAPGSMKGMNRINTVNLGEYREFINTLSYMKIEIKEITGRFNYNSFKVLDVRRDD